MKRLILALIVCCILSGASFAAVVVQDRYLDVPLPYTLPLAFASMLALAPALLALVERLRARRPIRIERPAPPRVREERAPVHAEPAPAPPARRAPVQGVVLLDFSSAGKRGRAA